jgi:hypothetical protein
MQQHLEGGCFMFALTEPERKQLESQHSIVYRHACEPFSGENFGTHFWFQIVFILFSLLIERYSLFYDE